MASPVPLFQYIARSAIMGTLAWTLVDMSLLGSASFTRTVLRDAGGMVNVGCATGPLEVM